jgi:hypothetical protein
MLAALSIPLPARPALFALFGASLLATSTSRADAPAPKPRVAGITLVRGSGRAKTIAGHEYRPVSAGDVLTPQTVIESSPDEPIEMQTPDGVNITMEPGSLAWLLAPVKLPSETNGWAQGYHLSLRDGELDVRMPVAPKGSHAFLVSTTAGMLTDWRGTLHVTVHHDTTAAAIYEGALVVGSNGQGFPVYDGAGILMKKGIDPDKSRTIPAATTWRSDSRPPSLAVAPGATLATLGFAWTAVPGATSYRVAIATDPDMHHVFQRAAVSDTSYVLSERQGEPRYFATVRAIGSEGIVGEASPPRPLRVLHYVLPDGAVLARDGAVVLPQGVGLALPGYDGVEAAFENLRGTRSRVPGVPLYWSKLTGPLRLPEDVDARLVHLRDAANGGEALLTIARRELRADVTLSPSSPTPGAPIDVRATVWDPSGRIDPASESVTLQALHDIDPIPVAWQRTGSTWTARIGVSRTVAPSVVRVVVKDARGIEIGRGFLEIDGMGGDAARARTSAYERVRALRALRALRAK